MLQKVWSPDNALLGSLFLIITMNFKNMLSIESLYDYIEKNEVVYQEKECLIEVANDKEVENRKYVESLVKKSFSVKSHNKGDLCLDNGYEELINWSTDNDILFLLEPSEVMICIPKACATENILSAC